MKEIQTFQKQLDSFYSSGHSTGTLTLCMAIEFLIKLDTVKSGWGSSVVECLTRDRGATGSNLTGITALLSLGKTHLS